MAAANLEGFRLNLDTRRVQLVESDVATFDIPNDVNTIYLFNPFSPTVLEAMLNNLNASISRYPRAVRLLYLYYVGRAVLMRFGFQEEKRIGEVSLYTLKPAPTATPL